VLADRSRAHCRSAIPYPRVAGGGAPAGLKHPRQTVQR
jgi:hypothetical protein